MPADEGLVVIGRVGRPHGLRGEIRLAPTGPTLPSISSGEEIVLRSRGGASRAHRVTSLRPANDVVLVHLEGIDDRVVAGGVTGWEVLVHASRLVELDAPDEFYVRDLIGCTVAAATVALGTVVDVHEGAANDALLVRGPAGEELLVPFTHDAIVSVDLNARRLAVRPDLFGEDVS
jgi:16S rRNA processing protein RimM